MSDWTQLALIIGIAVPVGIAVRIYLEFRHRDHLDRLKRVGQTISWRYHAAGTVLFAAMAVASWERLPFLILFGAFAVLELLYTVRAFVRQRTQYSLLHLFIATTCAAIFAGLCRWFGMAMAVVAGVGAGAAAVALFVLEWTEHSRRRN